MSADLASTSEKDDWDLEQRAFHAANSSAVPEDVRETVKDLWREYCALTSPAPAESGEAAAWVVTQTRSDSDEFFPESRHVFFAPLPDHYRTETWSRTGKPMWKIEPLYAHPPAESAGSPSTSGVVVKPLEWSSEAPYGVARVPKIGLMYSTEAVWYEGIFQHVELLGSATGRFPTVAAARAHAQADYEARIRSALSAAPTQDGGNGSALTAAEARVAQLETALKPFARVPEIPQSFSDADTVQASIDYTMDADEVESLNRLSGGALTSDLATLIVSMDGLTAADFRRARTALSQSPDRESAT